MRFRGKSSVKARLPLHRGGAELHVSVGDPGSVLERLRGRRRVAGHAGKTGAIAAGAPPGGLSAHCSGCCPAGYVPTLPMIPPEPGPAVLGDLIVVLVSISKSGFHAA